MLSSREDQLQKREVQLDRPHLGVTFALIERVLVVLRLPLRAYGISCIFHRARVYLSATPEWALSPCPKKRETHMTIDATSNPEQGRGRNFETERKPGDNPVHRQRNRCEILHPGEQCEESKEEGEKKEALPQNLQVRRRREAAREQALANHPLRVVRR